MGLQTKILRRLPPGIRVYPLDAMLALLGLPSGISALVGLASSRALDELLPVASRALWAACLIIGSACWLWGVLGTRIVDGLMEMRRVPIMILGLYLLSSAALVYAVALLMLSGIQALLAAWSLLAFSAGLYLRRIDLAAQYRREG